MHGDHRPSFTASAVAAARAWSGIDPIAPALLGGPLGWLVRAWRRPAAINLVTLGLVDHLELRTRAIDAAAHDALARGTRQVVILGAGLDARAWRMTELADTVVFEVDHPSTQAYKRARIGTQAPCAREVRFVAVDFARDALADALARAGHAAAAPTLWIWEGVTPYLSLAATRATLQAIAPRSAAGSALAVTYATPRRSATRARVMQSVLVGFRVFGEPIVGLLAKDVMRDELEAAGFTVTSDTHPRDWAARFDGAGRERRRLLFAIPERLAVATR